MKHKHITLLASIGAGLEYYDFVIYAMLASYLSKNFFVATNHYVALLETFCVFSIGYIARPVGGIIFGHLGDKYGRKSTFSISILIMAASTLLMGLSPTYHTFGIYATILFTLFRILQGLSYGAEMPGALTFLCEHIVDNKRGTHTGIMIMCVGFSTSFASFILFLLSSLFTEKQILNYAWRIPFILGSILGVVSFFIRRNTTETPEFTNSGRKPNFAFIELFRNHPTKFFKAIGIMLFPACFVIFFLYIPSLLKSSSNFDMPTIGIITSLAYVWSTILIPFFGWLSDKITRKVLMLAACIVFVILGFPFFQLIHLNSLAALLIFVLFYHTILAVMAGCYFAMLPELFPVETRFTGVALSYNLAYLIASAMPAIASFILLMTSSTIFITAILIAICLITISSLLTVKNSNKLA